MKETNMEHYRGEIEKLIRSKTNFGVQNGKPEPCHIIGCSECEIESGYCITGTIEWLMSEYKEEPVLTQREKHFVEFIQEGWIARDKNECVYWFSEEPAKEGNIWWNDNGNLPLCDVGDGLFPFITWEDEEPWAVEELRKLKVENA